MVEFEYRPWNKIVIHEIIKWPLEQFLLTRSIGVQEGGLGRPLTWANGIIFDRAVMPPTPEIIKENLQGIVHWNSLIYGDLEKYQEEFPLPRQVKIKVVNQSHTPMTRILVKWLKQVYEPTLTES